MTSPGEDTGRGPAGFTLLEALISLAVFAVILIAILRVYEATHQSYIRGEARADLQQNVRVAIDEILHDARLAGYDPSNAINAQTIKTPLQPVSGTSLSTSELRLIGDVNNGGVTDCVAYRLSSGQILRRFRNWTSGNCTWTAAEGAVADNITGFTITYFQATGAVTTVPAEAKRIQVQITGFSQSYGTTFVETSEAALRQ